MQKKKLSVNEISKLTYIYQAFRGIEGKFKEIESVFDRDEKKRLRTAITNADKGIAGMLLMLDASAFRQLNYNMKIHEVCMIPRREKMKHLKNIQKSNNLFKIRESIIDIKCNYCDVKDKTTCKIREVLIDCGTPNLWEGEYELDEKEKRMAGHCEFCGGFQD